MTEMEAFNGNVLQECGDPTVQRFAGIRVVLHEKYSPYSHDWDVAVIHLPRPLAYNDFVQPICLPSTPVAAGTRCVVTGWGATKGRQSRIFVILFRSRFDRQSAVNES